MHDDSYAAAFAVKTSLEIAGRVRAHSYWTFSDIFEEDYFPSVPFHGGFGLLNLQGIPKPVYRAHELLHGLGTDQLPIDGTHSTVDAWVVRDNDKVAVLCTNWGLPRHPVKSERIRILLTDAPRPAEVNIRRIDAKNANAKHEWRRMGEPEYLSEKQVQRLRKASELRPRHQDYRHTGATLDVSFSLAPQSVAALDIRFPGRRRRPIEQGSRGFHDRGSRMIERDDGRLGRDGRSS
jgi:xylan 1,4-beta-xylosidase